jgi:CheY-like chemotaxis protein
MKICAIWDQMYPENYFPDRPEKSIKDTDQLKKADLTGYDAIFILAELNWIGHRRAEFLGLSLAKDLRLKDNLTCPVVVFSFMGSFADCSLFNYPGYYHVHLPEKPLSTDKYIGIDEDTVTDINIELSDPKNMLHVIMHDLENQCTVLAAGNQVPEELSTTIKQKVSEKLEKFSPWIEYGRESDFRDLMARLIKELKGKIDESEFQPQNLRPPFNTYKEEFYSLLKKKLDDFHEESLQFPRKRWHILFIDDQKTTCQSMKDSFEKRGMICHTACNATEAFEKLKEDEAGKRLISMVIADFRLYENGMEGKWQDLQGYKILSTIHEGTYEGRPFSSQYAYAILTDKSGTILEYIKHQSKFRIQWFRKSDVLPNNPNAFNLFYERICELGSEAFFRKHTIPNLAVWTKGTSRVDIGYYYYYKSHIESTDYDYSESEINRIARENIQEITSDRPLKDVFTYQLSLKVSERKGKKKPVESSKYFLMQEFRTHILTSRRIVWGLFCLGFSWEDIFDKMKPGFEGKEESNSKTFFNTSLGITTISDKKRAGLFRYALLREELFFIEQLNEASIDVSKIRGQMEDFLLIEEFFDCLMETALKEDVKEIQTISNALTTGGSISVTDSQLRSVVNKIYNRLENLTTQSILFTSYKKATESFFILTYPSLSEKYKNILSPIKYQY